MVGNAMAQQSLSIAVDIECRNARNAKKTLPRTFSHDSSNAMQKRRPKNTPQAQAQTSTPSAKANKWTPFTQREKRGTRFGHWLYRERSPPQYIDDDHCQTGRDNAGQDDGIA